MNVFRVIFLVCCLLTAAFTSQAINPDKPILVEDGTMHGDVNSDKVIDIADLNIIINIIIGLDDADNYEGRADVAGGGVVDVASLNELINIILNKSEMVTTELSLLNPDTVYVDSDSLDFAPGVGRSQWKPGNRIYVAFDNQTQGTHTLRYTDRGNWALESLSGQTYDFRPQGTLRAVFLEGTPDFDPDQGDIDGPIAVCADGTYVLREYQAYCVLEPDIHLRRLTTRLLIDGVVRPTQLNGIPSVQRVTSLFPVAYETVDTTWTRSLSDANHQLAVDCLLGDVLQGDTLNLSLTYTNSVRSPRESYRRKIVLDRPIGGTVLHLSGPHGPSSERWTRDINFAYSGAAEGRMSCFDEERSLTVNRGGKIHWTTFEGPYSTDRGSITAVSVDDGQVASVTVDGSTMEVTAKGQGMSGITFTFTASDGWQTTRTVWLTVR